MKPAAPGTPRRLRARLRALAKRGLPAPLLDALRVLRRRVWVRRARQLARQDALFTLLEQKLEVLESLVFHRLEELEARLPGAAAPSEPRSELREERVLALLEAAHAVDLEAYARLAETRLAPGQRALDLGCGRGDLLEVLARAGLEARGVDASAARVLACRQRGLDAEVGDAIHALAVRDDASLDALFCLHLVEHLDGRSLADLLREARRCLAPGGLLVIETPKVASLATLSRYYFIDPTHRLPRHHEQLKLLLEAHDFDLESAEDVSNPEPGALGLELEPFAADPDEGALASRVEALAGRVHAQLDLLNEHLFVARDIRLLARRRPEPAA